MLKIALTSIMVDDQDKAMRFYTDILGFVVKQNFPVGEYKWLTVVSPAGAAGVELLLEPNANPVGKTFQEALYKQGIPYTAFEVTDMADEHERLKKLGVVFSMEPTDAGPAIVAVFDDTCGNLIQIFQRKDVVLEV